MKVKRLILTLGLCAVFIIIIKNNDPDLSVHLPDVGASKKAENVNLNQSIKEKSNKQSYLNSSSPKI